MGFSTGSLEDNMPISQKNLYKEISAFKIDDDSIALPFSGRLARENNWSASYSRKVLAEYKKFIYLSCISDGHVTPSDQIDQAWHLHLTYTKSYWIELCQNILNSNVHHFPTKGGDSESDKYRKQYEYTLELYEREFDDAAPDRIWPSIDDRFKDADKFVRLNKTNHWVIKKPPKFTAFLVLLSLFIVACTRNEGDSEFWFYIKIAFGIYVTYKVIQWLIKNVDSKGGGSGAAGCGGCGGCC